MFSELPNEMDIVKLIKYGSEIVVLAHRAADENAEASNEKS